MRCLFFLLSFVFSFDCLAQDQRQVHTAGPQTMLENGLELVDIDRPYTKYKLVRLRKQKHGIKVLRAQDYGKKVMTAAEICAASGALMCINASFFDENENPLGLIVSSGILFQKIHQGGDTLNGIFSLSRKGFSIVERTTFTRQLAFEAIQAGPILLANGNNLRDKQEASLSRRAAVCLNQAGEPGFFISSEQSIASTLYDLADVMKAEGCIDGINLDGGGSAQMFLRSKSSKSTSADNIALEVTGQDKVPLFIGVVDGMPF